MRSTYMQTLSGADAPAAASPAAAPESAPMGAPMAVPGSCECNFQDMCTCESALAHLDCISKTCAKQECDCPAVQFSQSCGQMASVCKPMLDISCTPKQAVCDGKFYQLASSLIGLSIDIEKLDNDAHCGSAGKCTGKIDIEAAIYNPAKGMHMECFLEDAPKSKMKTHCSSEVTSDFANCTIDMPTTLPAGDKLEGWCRLVARADDNSTEKLSQRLTHDAPFYIYNHHKAIETETETQKKMAEAPPPAAEAAEPAKSGAQGMAVLFLAATSATLYL